MDEIICYDQIFAENGDTEDIFDFLIDVLVDEKESISQAIMDDGGLRFKDGKASYSCKNKSVMQYRHDVISMDNSVVTTTWLTEANGA